MYDEIEGFVNWLRRRNPQARTWRDYGYDLKQFSAAVGNRPPNTITFKDVDNFIIEQAAQGYQPATINRRLTAVTSLYTFLADEDPGLVCPVLPHRHSLREDQRLPRPVPAADLERFFAVIKGSRDRAMFLLMLDGGLRISEVARLRLGSLYLDESPPRLLVQGKNRKERSVYLSAQAVTALQAYLAEREPVASDYLFLSYQGDGLSTTAIHKRLMRYREQAGVTLTAHRLRHTCATQLVNAGCRITTIQALLGHRRLNTTMVYARVHDRTVAEDYYAAMAVIERRLEPPLQQPAETVTAVNGAGQQERTNGSHHLLELVDTLNSSAVGESQRMVIAELRRSLLALAA